MTRTVSGLAFIPRCWKVSLTSPLMSWEKQNYNFLFIMILTNLYSSYFAGPNIIYMYISGNKILDRVAVNIKGLFYPKG